MDGIVTEVLNNVVSVADENIKSNSATEPSKNVKYKKPIIKECKVLYWNKENNNLAFQYENKQIQIVLSEPLKSCGATVRIECTDGKYKLLER